MFRTDLSFLEAMFPFDDYRNYTILVVNQTDANRQLSSEHENIRIINTEERGLSNSRNMAMANAIGDVCLLADDDVKYVKGFREKVLAAFLFDGKAGAKVNAAAVITFQAEDEEGNLYRNYPNVSYHTPKTIQTVNGVVIGIRLDSIRNAGLQYNPLFGLGAPFETADEFVFMKDVLALGLEARFEKEVILRHAVFNSGMDSAADRIVFARAALTHKYYGPLSYLWVFKYVRFLWAHKLIGFDEIRSKIKVGFAGIKKYKKLISLQKT